MRVMNLPSLTSVGLGRADFGANMDSNWTKMKCVADALFLCGTVAELLVDCSEIPVVKH